MESTDRKWRRYPARLGRTALMGGVFLGMFAAASGCFRFGCDPKFLFEIGSIERTVSIGCVLVFVLALNTVLGKFALFDRREKASFLERYKNERDFSIRRELGVILHSREFLIEFWGLAVFMALLPASVFEDIPAAIFGESVPEGLAAKAIILAVSVPLIFGLDLFSYISARKYWIEDGRERIGESAPELRLAKWLIMSFLFYCVGFFLLPLAFPVVTSIGVIFVRLGVWRVIPGAVLIVLGLVVLTYVRALFHRWRFIKNLKTLCREYRFDLSPIEEPYRSVFRESEGENFTVAANGKIYACKLLASVKRSNAMSLSSEGVCAHIISFCIRRVEFFRIENTTDYRFDSRYHKMLVVTPVPKRLCAVDDKRGGEMDNGDRIGEYRVFSGGALLRAMERDCLDRSVL